MLEKVNQLAEDAATSVSRRGFLGALGKKAAIAATALGGALAFSATAHAAKKVRTCSTRSSVEFCRGVPVGTKCPAYDGREGRCVASYTTDGEYFCNECKYKGGHKRNDPY